MAEDGKTDGWKEGRTMPKLYRRWRGIKTEFVTYTNDRGEVNPLLHRLFLDHDIVFFI